MSIPALPNDSALREWYTMPQPLIICHYHRWEPLPHQIEEQCHPLHRPALLEVGAEEAGRLCVHPRDPETVAKFSLWAS